MADYRSKSANNDGTQSKDSKCAKLIQRYPKTPDAVATAKEAYEALI